MTWGTLSDYLVENTVDCRDRIWIIEILVILDFLANIMTGERKIPYLVSKHKADFDEAGKNYSRSLKDFENILSAGIFFSGEFVNER